jgi:hypothetical protein
MTGDRPSRLVSGPQACAAQGEAEGRVTPPETLRGCPGPDTRSQARRPASLHAEARRGPAPCARRVPRDLRLLLGLPRAAPLSAVCGAAPAPAPPWRTLDVQPGVGRGRYEGTARGRGRSDRPQSSRPASGTRRERRTTCWVPPWCRGTSIWTCRQAMVPRDAGRAAHQAETMGKSPLRGGVCLVTTGGLISVRRRNWYRASDWHGLHDTWPSGRGNKAPQRESGGTKKRLVFAGRPFARA